MRRAPLRRNSAGAAAGPHVLTKMLVAYVSIRQHTARFGPTRADEDAGVGEEVEESDERVMSPAYVSIC